MSKESTVIFRIDKSRYSFLEDVARKMSKQNNCHVTVSEIMRFIIDYFFMSYMTDNVKSYDESRQAFMKKYRRQSR